MAPRETVWRRFRGARSSRSRTISDFARTGSQQTGVDVELAGGLAARSAFPYERREEFDKRWKEEVKLLCIQYAEAGEGMSRDEFPSWLFYFKVAISRGRGRSARDAFFAVIILPTL
jgi:hypothetical protein